jgi:SAM-dependent methyltransferase
MSDQHPEISEDRIYFFKEQEIVVNDFDASGYILDIGGGGEGIVGKLKGEQVVAIDPNKRELEEAAPGPLKIVMNGTDLQFLNNTFNMATAFFTLMYIKGHEHEKVFDEVYRVLSPGGRFLIWDGVLPQCLDEEKEIVAFLLRVQLPDEEVTVGYGAKWPEQEQNLSYYTGLAEGAGFTVLAREEKGQTFFLELQKP